ncbi:hypothetical protein [Pseudotabrizicola sp. 4114]|uniref:hypothetical protein n=1 Tax=Pseudotabrizicola sp. 4114 TaxID=2817731 RepID=UPI002863FC66|nr:hypothetical protein [Pseudorhodobacter sp. 4114]
MQALIDPGASGAKAATVQGAQDFDLCGLRLLVAQVEGTVQLVFLRDGWEGGPRKALANVFVDSATPVQLRALANHLDTLPLDAVSPLSGEL